MQEWLRRLTSGPTNGKEGQLSQIHIVVELRNRLIWIQFNLGCVDKRMSPPGDHPYVSIYILDFLTV